jgi:hypothetical protein
MVNYYPLFVDIAIREGIELSNTIILEKIKNMSEKESKKILATILLNFEKIGKNNYTKETFFKDVEGASRDIVVEDMF